MSATFLPSTSAAAAAFLLATCATILQLHHLHAYRIIIGNWQTPDDLDLENFSQHSRSGDVVRCHHQGVLDGSCGDPSKIAMVTQNLIDDEDGISCTNIYMEAADCSVDEVELCYDLSTSHWYGGTTTRVLRWPMENLQVRSIPYVTGDGYVPDYGGVMERYWFNSNGLGIVVDWESPLWVSINGGTNDDGLFCLRGRYLDSPFVNYDLSLPSLNVTQCQGRDVRHIHDYMSSTYIARPNGIPDEQMFRDPIWSTWAQYKEDVDQDKVVEFADAIRANGFNCSQLEIDDRWEPHYGELQFDLTKFPSPRALVESLRGRGMRTTLWVHPFINIDADTLQEAVSTKVYVGDPASTRVGQRPAFTTWWQGANAVIIDFTDSEGKTWFKNRLTKLQLTYGINSFKFDAGETNWLPNAYKLSQMTAPRRNPSYYTTAYVELAYSIDQEIRQLEVRVGARTQHLPIFVRMMDKDSNWNYNNGLATVIPNALVFGLIGYPFVLPDMVGGNAYVLLPNRELFIRWAELNVFLPSIQFSIVPWQYDAELVQIISDMMELRARYSQLLIDLAREAVSTGAPIVRPLWWIAPNDTNAQTIDNEFLVGNDLLVAPVVEQGATARDVYLPAGRWRDQLRNEDLDGGQWYNGYRVELNELAYFTKISA